jgi:hypothetical protein
MIAGKYVDPAETYENFATDVAHYLGRAGADTPEGLRLVVRACYNIDSYPELAADIDSDPVRFYDRVHANLYAIAMQEAETRDAQIMLDRERQANDRRYFAKTGLCRSGF